MPFSRRLQLAALPLLPIALAALVGLGIVVFRHGLATGGAELWLMAWGLAFVVGLPVLLTVLAIAGRRPRRVVPYAGEIIPRTGQ